ncbi:MAG: CvpA family protein [Acidobacteria bacterium]|nr:CvpA family protein [Acidobacteriota bacterium]
MIGLDWLILSIVVASMLMAAGQGIFVELFSLAGAVLGFLLAAWNHVRLAAWYAPYVKSDAIAAAAGFLTIFVVVLFLAGVAGRTLSWMMKHAGLSWFDRALGAVFGFARGVVVATVIVMALLAFVPESRITAGSALGPYLIATGRVVSRMAPAEMRDRFLRGVDAVRKAASPGGSSENDEQSGKK